MGKVGEIAPSTNSTPTLGYKILCTIASVWSKTIPNTGSVGSKGVPKYS